MKHLVTNMCGSFVFDKEFNLIDKLLIQEYSENELLSAEKSLLGKHPGAEVLNPIETQENNYQKILKQLRESCSKELLLNNSLTFTKKAIKKSVGKEIHIIQAINNIEDVQKVVNLMSKRLKEWYGYYSPEIVEAISDHKKFAEQISKKSRESLLKEFGFESSEKTMGADFGGNYLEPIMNLAQEILGLFEFKDKQIEFIETMMQEICPNLYAISGALIGAKLIQIAGSLKRLSRLPASTVQTLGAEKALFRHLKSNARPPKHGVLVNHPLVMAVDRKDKGRVARTLANKISLAVKIDYFGGDEYKGYEMREELDKKFKVKK